MGPEDEERRDQRFIYMSRSGCWPMDWVARFSLFDSFPHRDRRLRSLHRWFVSRRALLHWSRQNWHPLCKVAEPIDSSLSSTAHRPSSEHELVSSVAMTLCTADYPRRQTKFPCPASTPTPADIRISIAVRSLRASNASVPADTGAHEISC